MAKQDLLAELMNFKRDPKEAVDKEFFDIESHLKNIEGRPEHNVLRATLYLNRENDSRKNARRS